MGSAPPTGEHPALPDPARLARQSVKIAQQRGRTHGQAVWKIIGVVRSCQRWLQDDDAGLYDWLTQVEAACWKLSQDPKPPATDTKEHDHGG